MSENPYDPGAIYARMVANERATQLALAILFKTAPDALDAFEDLAININSPISASEDQVAIARTVKRIRDYQRVLQEIDKGQP